MQCVFLTWTLAQKRGETLSRKLVGSIWGAVSTVSCCEDCVGVMREGFPDLGVHTTGYRVMRQHVLKCQEPGNLVKVIWSCLYGT